MNLYLSSFSIYERLNQSLRSMLKCDGIFPVAYNLVVVVNLSLQVRNSLRSRFKKLVGQHSITFNFRTSCIFYILLKIEKVENRHTSG